MILQIEWLHSAWLSNEFSIILLLSFEKEAKKNPSQKVECSGFLLCGNISFGRKISSADIEDELSILLNNGNALFIFFEISSIFNFIVSSVLSLKLVLLSIMIFSSSWKLSLSIISNCLLSFLEKLYLSLILFIKLSTL